MMESVIIILAAALVVQVIAFLAFVVWRELENRKQVDVLTSKIMAKDYVEYASNHPSESLDLNGRPKNDKPKRRVMPDPVLGSDY